MFCFHKKKKKKNNTALIIIGIVIGVAAAAVGGYFLFTKVLMPSISIQMKKRCPRIRISLNRLRTLPAVSLLPSPMKAMWLTMLTRASCRCG